MVGRSRRQLGLGRRRGCLVAAAPMMSVWLLTNASAQALNGTLVKLINPLGQTNYFIFLGSVAIVITVIILAFTPKISKAMKGIH